MERIKGLSKYQKMILVLLLAMTVVFAALYAVVSSRVGYAYKDAILVPREETDGIVYTGRIKGDDVCISSTWNDPVTGQTVTVRHGQKTYGPYTARKDPEAIPEDQAASPYATGVELRLGEKILFRGGVVHTDQSQMLLYNEDGSFFGAVGATYTTGDGVVQDESGNPVDLWEPSVWEIVEVMKGPELTSKGQWGLWALGVALSVVTAVLVLFPDELFRWKMSFRISNAYAAEPSDLELTGRYISWMVMLILALIVYIMGLTL